MKDTYVIFGICVLSVAFGSWLYFGEPTIPGSAQVASVGIGSPVTFTEIEDGTNAMTVPRRVNYRVRNQSQLATLWSLVYGASTTPPNLDFKQYEVLAAFDGTHPTGGYSISISGIMQQDGKRTITIVHTVPGPTCVTAQVATTPFDMVLVPTTSSKLRHIDETATTTCP